MKSEFLIILLQFIVNIVLGDGSGKFGYYKDLTRPNIIKEQELNNKELNTGYYGDTYECYSQDLIKKWNEQKKDIGEGYWQRLGEEEIELNSLNAMQNVSYKGNDFTSFFENKVASRKIANVSEVCSTVQVMSFWHFVNDIIDSIHNQFKGTIENYKKMDNQGIYSVDINNFKKPLEDTKEQSKEVITSSQIFSNCRKNQDKSIKIRTKNNNINLLSKRYNKVSRNKTFSRKKDKSQFKHECTVSSKPNALRNCEYFGKQSYYILSNTK
ncbi:hypothetical protein ACR3K2_22750 [Cryptosporidium serpentis]